MSGDRPPLPPATFEFLVFSLRAQVEMQMGLYQLEPEFDSQNEPFEPDFELARHGLDMLAVLLEKTQGNLDLDEKLLLENTLTELRFRYVQVTGEGAEPLIVTQEPRIILP